MTITELVRLGYRVNSQSFDQLTIISTSWMLLQYDATGKLLLSYRERCVSKCKFRIAELAMLIIHVKYVKCASHNFFVIVDFGTIAAIQFTHPEINP